VRQQTRAGFGERDAAAGALKQVLSQLQFQSTHPPAQRGLRHRKRQRRAREAAKLGDLHEVFELSQVDANSL
jgi:hypothetical protein